MTVWHGVSPVRGSGNREVDDLPGLTCGNAVAVVNRLVHESSRAVITRLSKSLGHGTARWFTGPVDAEAEGSHGLSGCDLRCPRLGVTVTDVPGANKCARPGLADGRRRGSWKRKVHQLIVVEPLFLIDVDRQ